MTKNLQEFRALHRNSIGETYKFAPRMSMNLLLNFESFDQTTAQRDVYMPEEKVINFNVGFIKLNFLGKLRLTAERSQTKNVYTNQIVNDYPSKTFGVTEERDLLIKSDKPLIVKHLFIRPHFDEKNIHEHRQNIWVQAFRKDNLEYQYMVNVIPGNREWVY